MFVNRSHLLYPNPRQMNYGMAVTDIDDDGQFEVVVAGFGFPNQVLKWIENGLYDIANEHLRDRNRQAIGVAAGDLDQDGQEEIYILNTDTFGGIKRLGDRLFDRTEEGWTDLFSVPAYQSLNNLIAGRSVACVDRFGNGRYGFFVVNYGGAMALYELDEDGHLQNVASEAQLDYIAGGRSVVIAPLISRRSDIFVGTEGGNNFLFYNNGDGTFADLAESLDIQDPLQHVRGVAVIDGGDGGFYLAYGNWEGSHRLFAPQVSGGFRDIAPPEWALPSRIRTLLAADFDNDGYEEVFFNHIGQANRLFAWRDGFWQAVPMGAALEPRGLGTGAVVADLDGDGQLELLVSHGESGMQPLTLYQVPPNGNHWIRILPFTAEGAPARGAVVVIQAGGRQQKRVIDGGSGYLCQMEPVAHFGLGELTQVDHVEVRFTDGTIYVHPQALMADQVLRVPHP